MTTSRYKGINQTLQGFHKVSVIDEATNNVVWEQDTWKKNLILNQGMDVVASQYLADLTINIGMEIYVGSSVGRLI